MTADDFKRRTKQFALRAIRLVDTLPAGRSSDVIAKQLLRSATSVGANYRAACRGRSPAEFQAKLGIVEEEADESGYWLELLVESGRVRVNLVKDLMEDASAIVAMTIASIKTSRSSSSASNRRQAVSKSIMNPKSEIRNPK